MLECFFFTNFERKLISWYESVWPFYPLFYTPVHPITCMYPISVNISTALHQLITEKPHHSLGWAPALILSIVWHTVTPPWFHYPTAIFSNLSMHRCGGFAHKHVPIAITAQENITGTNSKLLPSQEACACCVDLSHSIHHHSSSSHSFTFTGVVYCSIIMS